MCNDYRLSVDIASIIEEFADLKIKIRFGVVAPNLSRETISRSPIVRSVDDVRGEAELVQRRWSWSGPNNRPVYNFRSEGRDFASNRCLIIADGFYEFTDPNDTKKKRKDKWLFTKSGEPIFCIAGIWRTDPEVGEAFTMLTMEPGADVAPYHDRQIVLLERSRWADWLDASVPEQSLIKPLPRGSLQVERVR